jgi:Tol biopolymer transport system component
MGAHRSHVSAKLSAPLVAGLVLLVLASSAGGATSSRSSPGDWIAVEGGGGLAVVDAWTGARRQVAVFVESEAAWSPDHRALAYVAGGALRTSRLATGRQRMVTRLGGRFSIGPSWSKRGGRLALTVHGALSDVADLIVVGRDGRRRRLVDRAAASYQVPQWSPDGRRLAYIRNAADDSSIWVARANGGRRVLQRHVLDNPRSLSWSPDGRRVAFVGSPAGVAAGAAVHVANANGAQRRAVSSVTPQLDDPSVGFVKWSPNARRIAFLRWAADGKAALCVTDLNGRERVLVPAASISDFAWSPGGRWLAYLTDSPGTLWVLRADGSELRKVGRLSDEVEAIAWG